MTHETVTKVMRKLAEGFTERAHLMASADFRRPDRIEAETGHGTVTFRTPVHCESIAISETPFGLRLHTDVAEADLPFLLSGKAYTVISRPEEGRAYPVPGIKSAEVVGKHVLSNTASNRTLYCEVTEALIEVYILRDHVIIDQYNACASTLTFRRICDDLGAIVDYDHELPGDIVVKLAGSHTEVESEELAELLMKYVSVMLVDGDAKKRYGFLALQRDGENDFFHVCDFKEVEDGNRENG